jgi:inosose dehydratase
MANRQSFRENDRQQLPMPRSVLGTRFLMTGSHMSRVTRRSWLCQSAGALAGMWWAAPVRSAEGDADGKDKRPPGCTLGYSTYATRGMPVTDAIRLIGATGFDALEIALMPGYGADPENLSAEDRRAIAARIADQGLLVTALMENLPPSEDDARHKGDLERLRRAIGLAHELAPAQLPLVQTVLGGGAWEAKRNLFRDRLGDWLKLFNAAGMTLAIKPHRGGAMSRPSEAIWLFEELGKPAHLRMVYDYSHYAFRDMPLEETVKTALPWTAHIAVKDAVGEGDKVTFALPGAGGFDYAPLLRQFYQGGYRGDVCCEVSGLVSSKPGYDPAAAAKQCYATMSRAFTGAEIPRHKPKRS